MASESAKQAEETALIKAYVESKIRNEVSTKIRHSNGVPLMPKSLISSPGRRRFL